MFNKNNFFYNFLLDKKKFKRNLKKTKNVFNSLLNDFESDEFPLFDSFKKDYEFDFSNLLIKKFRKQKNVIVIGIGGSILGTKAIFSFLEKKIKKKFFFFDNLDHNLNKNYKEIKNIKNSCFVVVSKSGNTIETIANLSVIFKKKLLKNKLVIITEIADNALISIANKYRAEIIEHKEFIGGRYSVLSEAGMFPVALMGLNLLKFRNFEALIKNKNFVSTLIQNVASIYTLVSKKINNSVILNYDSDLNDLGYWYQQLVAESLGKKGKGINPMLSFGPKDHHSLLQLYLDGPRDKFFTFFNSSKRDTRLKITKEVIPNKVKFLKNKNLKLIIDAQNKATKTIFNFKKIPYRQFTFNKKNEEELGKIINFFVLETILLARLTNVDPFNQPAVEQIKIETKKILR